MVGSLYLYNCEALRNGKMAVGLASNVSHNALDEEARAEVDVLNSRLDKTTQLTKKIQACLGRLDATGQSVREVAGPLNGETRRLQVLGSSELPPRLPPRWSLTQTDVDSVIAAIDRLRQPADSKDDEEQIIRAGPEKAGLSAYLASMKRINRSHADMQASNLRANQNTMTDLTRLIKTGNAQLEAFFEKLLRTETPRALEPLHYITKDKEFPVLPQETITRLGLIYSHLGSNPKGAGYDSPIAKIYGEVRGPYLSASLVNLAAASVNTAKKKNPGAIYRSGTNGIGTYAQAMEAIFVAEYENVCSIFGREDWGPVFQAACQAPLAELARTLRELNAHIKQHLTTDCYLAYEVTEILSKLSGNLETRTGELKPQLAAALKPVRETAKSSLAELLEDTKRKVGGVQALPNDGAPLPIVSESMQRLQAMMEFLRPIASIMISLGDGGWKNGASARGADAIPSLASFDVTADGQQIFTHYCFDTIEGAPHSARLQDASPDPQQVHTGRLPGQQRCHRRALHCHLGARAAPPAPPRRARPVAQKGDARLHGRLQGPVRPPLRHDPHLAARAPAVRRPHRLGHGRQGPQQQGQGQDQGEVLAVQQHL